MLTNTQLLAILTALTKASATVAVYGQCGGSGYSGDSDCADGSTCVSLNDYYYQCTPSDEATGAATQASNTAATATTSTSAAATSAAAASSTTAEASTAAASSTKSTSTSSSSAAAEDVQTVSGGWSGTGTTTRYWDCCKPSCAWSGKSSNVDSPVLSCDASGNALSSFDTQSGCTGGTAYMCNNQIPWAVSDDLAYGFAAASIVGGSEDTMCCSCVKLTFTSTALEGKSMIVQITNTGSDLGSNQFDLALPGGGVGIYTAGCSGEFGDGYSWGEQYGGVSSESDCSALPTALYDGCEFRFDWFEGADNPSVSFEQVVCPEAITAISGCSRTDQ